jgi:hypothetical protein
MRARRRTQVHSLTGQRPERPPQPPPDSVPEVRLGKTVEDGVAPSVFALLERGVGLRPEVAARMSGRVVFRFTEDISPARVNFSVRYITVEDGDLHKPDLAIIGRLPHIVHFVSTPLVRGIPNPVRIKGLMSIARVARRRIKIEGDPALARGVLRLLAL